MHREHWRTAPGYDGLYEVSSLGRIRSLRIRAGLYDKKRKKPYIRKTRRNNSDRNIIDLPNPEVTGEAITLSVSRLICAAFHGEQPPGHECAHLNGLGWDDRAENLAWVTHKANCAHRVLHGTEQRGEKNYGAILTKKDVLKAREVSSKRGEVAKLARTLNVEYKTLWAAATQRTWAWLPANGDNCA